jgi:hypothetical protein
MDKLHQVIREIKTGNIKKPQKVSNLLEKLQVYRDSSSELINPDLILFGLATALEKISDYRVYELHNDARLNELNSKIKKIQEREGLGDDDHLVRGDPDSPEDYQALNIEFEYRIDEIRVDVMKEFGEKELAELFENNRMKYIKQYYNGWRTLEKDNPEKLEEIDESERLEELEELGEL